MGIGIGNKQSNTAVVDNYYSGMVMQGMQDQGPIGTHQIISKTRKMMHEMIKVFHSMIGGKSCPGSGKPPFPMGGDGAMTGGGAMRGAGGKGSFAFAASGKIGGFLGAGRGAGGGFMGGGLMQRMF